MCKFNEMYKHGGQIKHMMGNDNERSWNSRYIPTARSIYTSMSRYETTEAMMG